MTWIGGIFNKVNTRRNELRNRLALMTEAAFPTKERSAIVRSQFVNTFVDDVQSHALVQLSMSTERAQRKNMHAERRDTPTLMYAGHFYGLDGTKYEPCRAQRSSNQTSSKSMDNLLAGSRGTLEHKVRWGLMSMDGDYALAVSGGNVIVAARDTRGTKPLYFAENNEFCALASTKRPLWKIGLDEVRPLRAGTLAILSCQGVHIKNPFSRRKETTEIQHMAEAVDAYERALYSAVRKRLAEVRHTKKVGVLLSGGIDSCLIAKLVRDIGRQMGMETIAYTAGLSDAPDVTYAQEFADQLDIKCEIQQLDIDRVEECIPKVIEAIEDGDFVQVETGIGAYAAMDMASQDGTRVVFSGQGPDELWGGYGWYPRVLAKEGRQKLCWRMRDDFARADIETLDRENKIAMAHGIELFFPYLDTEVVNVAMSVASELKVASEQDHLGKHPHRQLAMKLGVPEKYANREKVAMQHGTGIHGLLDGIAIRNGFNHALVRRLRYKNEDITKEKLGSSARYGYRYIARELWQVPQHVQFFLYTLAYRNGLLNGPIRDRVGSLMEKAGLPGVWR